ncbi:hypothetical protein [Rhizobium rhizogenes]|uniref:hypothetical protein n=1 Tax=Rhizobium rhizogenes TaxID=359 RepID=UPI001574B470|nr:hypothetical protein [Rhizobium rhizogenes]NTH18438.1 hypothetical protein [Rhizobium rhizogenes]NTH31411.1 hypothetical protein [Rhizobium rhizogenes]
MKLSDKQARLLICDDFEDAAHFDEVQPAEITGDSRWSKFYEAVYKDKRDGTFWEISWSRGATEYQDEGPEDVTVQQVWPREVSRTIYVNSPE